MDFDVNWTIEDARMVTKKEYEAVKNDPENKEKIEALTRKGRMFTDSLRTLNQYCLPELAEYRKSLVHHSSNATQEQLLNDLYEKYSDNLSRTVISDAFSSFTNFFHFVFN